VKRMINAATSLRKLRASFWVSVVPSVLLVTALITNAACAPEVEPKESAWEKASVLLSAKALR
jgi:hypothetical protein